MQAVQSFLESNFSLTWWKPSRTPNLQELDQNVLNAALAIATGSGSHWLIPVQAQLLNLYPEMELNELDDYNEVCQSIIQNGITLANQPHPQSHYRGILPRSYTQTPKWKNYVQGMMHHYPWIAEDNLHSIYSHASQHVTTQLNRPAIAPLTTAV